MYRRISLAIPFVIVCFAVQLIVTASASAATASFVRTDSSTQGNWQSSYGADGYYIANSVSSAPSYGTFAPNNQLNYTWVASTSDPRALVMPGVGSGIAAAWYSPAPFSLAIHFTDSNVHQVAVYALDWDNGNRAESFQVTDASSGAILSTQSVASFSSGTYVVWNISGSVIINVTCTGGSNSAVSGIFFGSGSGNTGGGGIAESVSINPPSIGLAANSSEQFSATVMNGPQSVNWSIVSVNPSGVDPGSFSPTTNGLYLAPGSIASLETVTVEATTADQSASATATITLSSGSSATFVDADSLTQGSWQGSYGTDGYSLAGSDQSLPSYAALNVENAQFYTWAPSSTDPRALQIPDSNNRIASAWYSSHFSVPPTFTLDVNITDGQTHQVAIYALDWDGQGRAESVQVLDAVTNAQLDSRVLSNFTGGTYLVWNISGHVTIAVTETVGPNCVISGIFFGASNGSAIQVGVTPSSVFLASNEQQQFAASVTGTPNPSITWSVSPSGVGSISSSGLYTAPAQPSNGEAVTILATQQNAAKAGTATVNLTSGGVANFVATDGSTQGQWQGVYGADGYGIANVVPQNPPSYGGFTAQNATTYTWAPQTDDLRALTNPLGAQGIASAWYTIPTFSFNINLTDGRLHQVALYAVDWDTQGRTETIQIIDASSNQVLDTRTISNFANGTYVVWNMSGNVIVQVTCTGGPNAVVSGIFFGGGNGNNVNVTPQTVTLSASQTQQFSAAVGGPGGSVTWSVSGGGTISSTGLYQAPATITSPTTVSVTATGTNGAFGTASVLLSAGATATFTGTDTTTEGAWQTYYGTAGYSIAGGAQQLPPNTTFAVSNNNGTWVWSGGSTDPRALQIPGAAAGLGIAGCWYKNHESFALDVNFSDSNTHQVALYALDWDNTGRSESIVILDANTGKVLDTEQLANFVNGVYIKWNITGHVTINVTVNSGANGVISGAFFQ